MHGFTISFPLRNLHVFLLEDAIILSKANPCSGSTKKKRGNGYVRNNETMSPIFSFISTLYLKQQPIFFGAFPVQNMKIVYLAISFSDVYFAARGRFIQLKTPK